MLIIDKAKNGQETAYVEKNGRKNYIYSAYEPEKNLKIPKYNDCENYIILGYGLGYEVRDIAKKVNGKIFVVECEPKFIERYFKDKNEENVVLLANEEYSQYNFDEFELINLFNISAHYPEFYTEVLIYLNSCRKKQRIKKRIAVLEHITIANDVADAFEENGYDVIKIKWSSEEKVVKDILECDPDYVFTVNVSIKISEMSRKYKIKYIAWVVDTPCYTIYMATIYHKNIFVFLYDYAIYKRLNDKEAGNVFYLPVAAPIARFDKITAQEQDINVSFIGNTGIENEYNSFMKGKLSQRSHAEVEEIFSQQKCNGNYIIDKMISCEMTDAISDEIGYMITDMPFLNKNEKLGFLLSRKYNEIERRLMVEEICSVSDCKIYGDSAWQKYKIKNMEYVGEAEHYNEMPQLFKRSKININLTRVYVEEGLPMRVFDIMGSGGFLLTNYKKDLEKYFEIGKEIVVFNDFEDMKQKIEYYLKAENEKERIAIAEAGYKKVCKEHTYIKRVVHIMEIVNQE